MERSQSVPLRDQRLQRELQLEALRPKELPSPGDEAMPVRDAGLAVVVLERAVVEWLKAVLGGLQLQMGSLKHGTCRTTRGYAVARCDAL
jgi:hypothetical protein